MQLNIKDIALWIACAGVAGWLLYATNDCTQYTEGTDAYWQCVTGEEIDLGIQDEADTRTSKGRE